MEGFLHERTLVDPIAAAQRSFGSPRLGAVWPPNRTEVRIQLAPPSSRVRTSAISSGLQLLLLKIEDDNVSAAVGKTKKWATGIAFVHAVQKHLYDRAEPLLIEAFFEIGSQSEITFQELQKRLGSTQPIVASYIQFLGSGGYDEKTGKREGLGLVEDWTDIRDNRIRVCSAKAGRLQRHRD